jgi:small conductance mechanosensitive channel
MPAGGGVDTGPGRLGPRLAVAGGLLAALGAGTVYVTTALPDLLGPAHRDLEIAAVVAAWLVVGCLTVARAAAMIGAVGGGRLDPRLLTVLRNLVGVVGYGYVAVMGFSAAHISPTTVLLGGATVGIVLGIAAQSTLGNLFAGLLLVVMHPYTVGDRVTVRVGGMDYTGEVRELTLYYTVLGLPQGRQVVPNALVMTSAIRVEANGVDGPMQVPVPRGLDPDRVRAALAEAGAAPARLFVVDVGPTTYTASLEVPAAFGAEGVLRVLDRLALEPPPEGA